MEWYPSLFLKFFRQLIFPCRHMCSLETLGTIPTSRLVFVENVFTSLCILQYLVVLTSIKDRNSHKYLHITLVVITMATASTRQCPECAGQVIGADKVRT